MEDILSLIKKFRKAIIFLFVIFLSVGITSFYFSPVLISFISSLLKTAPLFQNEVAEGFIIRIKISFIIALTVVIFVMLFIIFKKILKNGIWFSVGSLLLFISGVIFSYYLLLPSTIRMLSTMLPYKMHIGISSFVMFCSIMMIVIGIMFEEPLVIYILYKANIITPVFLKSKRKYIYVGVLIFLAVITPSQDAVTLLTAMVPFVVLFEGALLWVNLLERKNNNE